MGSGLSGHALLAKRIHGALVQVERHDDGRFLASVHQDGRLASEARAGDHFPQDVACLGDLRAVFGAGAHADIVAESLLNTTAPIRFLSYDGHVSIDSGHTTCQHKIYRLTCAQYVGLLVDTGNLCQICTTPARDTWRGKLVIDHDHDHGIWAVRGLLCPRCNTSLERGEVTPQQAAYLASPWYGRNLAPLVLSEPAAGSVVTDGSGGRWTHTKGLWHPAGSYYQAPQSWSWLLRMFGPHRISMA